MKSPVETVRGRIVGYDERRGELLIRAPYSDRVTMTARQFKECLVQPMDSRPLSDKQRKACYALMGAIADYAGMSKDRTKELMKLVLEEKISHGGHPVLRWMMDNIFCKSSRLV